MRKYNEEKVYGEFLKWYYLDDMDYYDFYKKLGNNNYKISVVSFDEVLLDRDERNLPGYTTYEDFIDNYKNYMKISDNMLTVRIYGTYKDENCLLSTAPKKAEKNFSLMSPNPDIEIEDLLQKNESVHTPRR